MEGKAILKVLILAALLQAGYCAISFTTYTAYNDSACTMETGGVTVFASSNACNAAACQLASGDLYVVTSCATDDPIASGLPEGVASWTTYTSTDGSCSPATAPYDTVRFGLPGACFLDEGLNVVSFGGCISGAQKYDTWADYAGCLAGTSPNLSNSLADGTCLSTTGPDQKETCPVVAQPMAPTAEPMSAAPVDQPMSSPMAAAPVAQQPTATPVKTPLQSPAAKKSGAVAKSVATICLGMIILFL